MDIDELPEFDVSMDVDEATEIDVPMDVDEDAEISVPMEVNEVPENIDQDTRQIEIKIEIIYLFISNKGVVKINKLE